MDDTLDLVQQQNYERLKKKLGDLYRAGYRLESRIHPLRSVLAEDCRCFLKRDDELSFSISGSKIRKYASLLPRLMQQGVREAFLIGGAYSNNILGLSQLLIENGIRPVLFLRKGVEGTVQGNRLLIELLVEKSDIHWIERADWSQVEEMAASRAIERQSAGVSVKVIPEGAFLPEAFEGALTLPLDIHRNEIDSHIKFDHIFIDAGTGLQAAAMVLGLAALRHPAKIHIVLLADPPAVFSEKLYCLYQNFSDHLGEGFAFPDNFDLHTPCNATSFGSVNRKLFDFIACFARTEGVFLDPIYSAKLLFEAHRLVVEEEMRGNILFIHSGGGLSLAGFQPQLRTALQGI